MKLRNSHIFITAASVLMLSSTAYAADGIWNSTATSEFWDTANNWIGNNIADGSGFTANFSTLNITADTTVNLDTDRTIGNLIFGDTDISSAGSWILSGTGDPAATLTLEGASPTINVNALGTGRNARITATLEGTDGFTKIGAGTLVLNNATNTISGPVVLSSGLLSIQSKPLTNATSVALNAGTLVVATITGNAIGADNNAKIFFGGGTLQYNVSNPSTDYSARFSPNPEQQYRINVITASGDQRVATFGSSLLSEGGSLNKLGGGILVLSAENTFTGTTTITDGNLELTDPLALQNSAINTNASVAGTNVRGLILTDVTSPTFGGLIGSKALASLFDTDSGNYDSVTNVTLNPGTGANHTHSAEIADGAAGMTLTKTGMGRQVLAAANTYSGGTIMDGGTLNYGNATALSDGPISFTGDSILQAGVETTLANPISVSAGVIGTLGTGSFTTTLSGAITGAGTFGKGGGAAMFLTGGEANTVSGGISVFSGRLNVLDGLSLTNVGGPIVVSSGGSLNYSKNFEDGNDLTNNITISGPGNGTFGALNLQGNVDATGTITLADDATISHNFNFATVSGAISGTNRNLALTTTQSGQAGMVISGPISLGTGGITVTGVANSGDFSIKFSGSNSYSGETHIVSGTLMLSENARINNSSTVRIDPGAVLHLDFEGTDNVGALFFGGDPNPKPDGSYGSLTSMADNKSTDFAGDGILIVGGAVGNNFASWASANGISGQPFDGDFNSDGISNGVAYALGLSPTTYTQPAGVLVGNTITFTKGAEAIANADVTWIIETSTTLAGTWSEEVTQAAGDTTTIISLNLNPVPGTPKKFARLKVVKAP